MTGHLRLWTLTLALFSLPLSAHEGMVQLQSQYDVATTAERLVVAAKTRGLTVMNRIDHAAGAEKAGLALRPTELVIFGNPKVGTPIMQCSQTAGIDLPQKMLIWEDADGKVWLGYNNPDYLKKRHHLEECDMVLKKVEKALVSLAKLATQPSPK